MSMRYAPLINWVLALALVAGVWYGLMSIPFQVLSIPERLGQFIFVVLLYFVIPFLVGRQVKLPLLAAGVIPGLGFMVAMILWDVVHDLDWAFYLFTFPILMLPSFLIGRVFR